MSNTFDDWKGESLQHYGVLGMKWGQRRYQNPDGSLTAAGKKHYDETGEYGYHYHSHATKKYTRKAERANKKATQYALGATLAARNGNKRDSDKFAKKAKALTEKASKFEKRAKRSSEIDKGEQEYAKNISTGKAIALTLLTSGNTMKGYAQYRAMAKQSGKEFTGQKAMAGIKAYNAGAYGSRLAKAAYIRQDESKGTVGKTAHEINKKITNVGANLIDTLTADPDKKRRR